MKYYYTDESLTSTNFSEVLPKSIARINEIEGDIKDIVLFIYSNGNLDLLESDFSKAEIKQKDFTRGNHTYHIRKKCNPNSYFDDIVLQEKPHLLITIGLPEKELLKLDEMDNLDDNVVLLVIPDVYELIKDYINNHKATKIEIK